MTVYLVIANWTDEDAEIFGVYERHEDAKRAIEEDRAKPHVSRTGAYLAQVKAVEWHPRGET